MVREAKFKLNSAEYYEIFFLVKNINHGKNIGKESSNLDSIDGIELLN